MGCFFCVWNYFIECVICLHCLLRFDMKIFIFSEVPSLIWRATRYVGRFQGNRDFLDGFSMMVILVHNNISNGKLVALHTKIKTFLGSICILNGWKQSSSYLSENICQLCQKSKNKKLSFGSLSKTATKLLSKLIAWISTGRKLTSPRRSKWV